MRSVELYELDLTRNNLWVGVEDWLRSSNQVEVEAVFIVNAIGMVCAGAVWYCPPLHSTATSIDNRDATIISFLFGRLHLRRLWILAVEF